MGDYIISCSTTCDLTEEILNKNNNPFVRFCYYIDDVKHFDNFYKDISKNEFFDIIKTHNVKTSQPSPEEYISLWEPILKQNKDILHIELSSGISGAYNSAVIAKDMISSEYKNKVMVVDSLCASSGYGLLVTKANKLKQDGLDIEKCYNEIMELRNNVNHIFCSSDLSQYLKGGRISKVGFTIGTFMKIIPVMHVNADGKLEIISKARGFANAKNVILDLFKKNIKDGENYSDDIYISNSNCIDLVNDMVNDLKNVYKKANCNNIFDIGTVIGSHTGIGTLAIFYIGDKRV